MKCTSTAFALLAAAAAGVQAANIQLIGKVMNSAAKEGFEKSRTLVYAGGKTKRDAPKVYEPDPNRDYTLEDGYIFVLQCTTVGFRPECISFGSEPGKCVSYFNFDPKKGDDPTSISDEFNHNVTSISTTSRSLMITPRSIAKEGFVGIDREDYKDTPKDEYLKKVQASQLVIIEDKWLDSYKVRVYKE
ncbi:hypothetical protein H9Q72_012818 [Fusarium xylarioides]|uniref:Uncharacterized protein n=1 Tax=Fusarium xylarioides TaxID=221167 RepID=A0A9P7KZC0_9HYPO|nr:hypothetical protein H9Q72_012818 [Fusarium xylarioides]